MCAPQLNQDFALIRQKIMEGERPKFEDPTAPAESAVFFVDCVLIFDATQVPRPVQGVCEP
jgi:hypothetical protein